MSRKRNLIWEYFRIDPKDDKKALCVTCGESISRGGTTAKNFNTSNLRYHLQRVHIAKFEELELKQQEEADKKAEEYEVKQRKTDARQLTLAEVKERKDLWNYGHPQHKKVTGWIAEMIAIDSQPFSIVEDTGFLRLLSNICPLYALPSRKYFAEKVIPEMFSTIKAQLMKDIHPDGDSFPISFTTDIWTRDAGGDSFISWTAHYIDPINFTREERVLQVCPFAGSHTAVAISEMITKLLDSWKVPKTRVHTVVRDNAANMVAGIEQCGLPSIGCAIHTLQLVIKDFILAQRSVSDMLARCRKIVGHYKYSHLAVERLQDIQRQLSLPNHKLMQDEPTRWDSTYYMLERLVEQRRAISLYDTDFELPDRLNSNEWQLAEKIVKLLEPMQRITKEFSAKGAIVSQVIPFLEILKMELDSNQSSEPETTDKLRGILTTKDEMLSSLDSRFDQINSNDTYLLATLLDPRFKVNFFDTATTQSAIDRLIQACESDSEAPPIEQGNQQDIEDKPTQPDDDDDQGDKIKTSGPCTLQLGYSESDYIQSTSVSTELTSSTKKKGFSVYDSYKKAIKKLSKSPGLTPTVNFRDRMSAMISEYIHEPVIDNPKSKLFKNPLEYWKNNKQRYVILAALARKYLSAPPSSVASESLFSDAGIIDSNRRRCLLAERLEMLTFLKHNLKLTQPVKE